MTKWHAILSTTEPYNYIGIINVRQGNKNSEVIEAMVVENGKPVDLTGCKAYFEAVISQKFAIQRAAKIIDAKNGKIEYTFDEYSMQMIHKQTANFIFFKGEDVIATTQNFDYFVVQAVSKTEGEMGSYWQTVEDLIADMVAFLNENKGDFTDWMNARKNEFEAWRKYQQSIFENWRTSQQSTFEEWREHQETDYLDWFQSIKDILKSIDPGGVMLAELMDARVDIQGKRHTNISERLLADLDYLYQKLKERLFTLDYGEAETLEILQDDRFSINHGVIDIGIINKANNDGTLTIATIDDQKQDTFYLIEVGDISNG